MACDSLKRTIGNEIHVLEKMIRRTLDNSPIMKQVENITGSIAWIIGYIAHEEGDVFQRDLEKRFGITRSTVSKIVNLMVHKGLIERQSVPEDTRLKKLVLTERALQMEQLISEEFTDMERTLSDGFTPEELEQFHDFIHRMQRNVRKKEEERR